MFKQEMRIAGMIAGMSVGDAYRRDAYSRDQQGRVSMPVGGSFTANAPVRGVTPGFQRNSPNNTIQRTSPNTTRGRSLETQDLRGLEVRDAERNNGVKPAAKTSSRTASARKSDQPRWKR